MDIIPQIEQAVGQRAMYPIVALLLTFVMQVARKTPRPSAILKKIPDGWRWLLPVIAGGSLGFINGYQKGYSVTGALLEALAGLFGVSFTSMGVAAALKESPLPWDGGAGGRPTSTSQNAVQGP